jgi:peptide/nickel transport system permease protein
MTGALPPRRPHDAELISARSGIAPYSPADQHRSATAAPPQLPRFVDSTGHVHLRPFVYGYTRQRDETTLEQRYALDATKVYPVRLFVSAEPHRLFGVIKTDKRLFGVEGGGQIFLLGTDAVGADTFSRMMYGGRISLSIGLLGMAMTLALGALIGMVSGYFGGRIDSLIQRTIELLLAFPRIPLWMALAAAVPKDWSPLLIYFMITVILAVVSWGGLARQVRGMVLSLRDRDFVVAAQTLGTGHPRIVRRYLLPNIASHLTVVGSLAVPQMILAETALSFLGLGLRPPITSWGC